MSEHPIINIIYDTEQENFDFIIPISADEFILGDEEELAKMLDMLQRRIHAREYPFRFLRTEEYKAGDLLRVKHDWANNFWEDDIVAVTKVDADQVTIDSAVTLSSSVVSKHFEHYNYK